jgi:hypothetical protein
MNPESRPERERERERERICEHVGRKGRGHSVQLCHHDHDHVVVGVCAQQLLIKLHVITFFSTQNKTSHNKKSTNYFCVVCFLEMEKREPE